MLTNRDRFLYAVMWRIHELGTRNPPPTPPTSTDAEARAWFTSSSGLPRPPAVDTWMGSALSGLLAAVSPPTFPSTWGNALAYMAGLDAKISELVGSPFSSKWDAETQFAWHWFRDEPVIGEGSIDGEIPPEVIGWVRGQVKLIVVVAMMMAAKPGLGRDLAGARGK